MVLLLLREKIIRKLLIKLRKKKFIFVKKYGEINLLQANIYFNEK